MSFWKKKEDNNSGNTDNSGPSKSGATPPQSAIASSAKASEPAVLGGSGAAPARTSAIPSSHSSSSGEYMSNSAQVGGLGASRSSSSDPIENRFGVVRSALGPGTVIQGKLSFDTPVRIDGKLTGDIFSSQALIVGESGEIDATVEVATLIVMGKVSGKIKATDRIELWAGGKLQGEISTPIFMMEDSAIFNGSCAMVGAASAASKKSDANKGSVASDSKPKGDESHKEVRVH